jgi:hypothetical protein
VLGVTHAAAIAEKRYGAFVAALGRTKGPKLRQEISEDVQ